MSKRPTAQVQLKVGLYWCALVTCDLMLEAQAAYDELVIGAFSVIPAADPAT